MADELIDIVDENNNSLGITKMKSVAHKEGLWHRNAHIWIYNSKGEVLLQLRAKDKPFLPNMWDISVAGHVSAGEDPVLSALREVKEEIGLEIQKKDLSFWKIVKFKIDFRKIKNYEFCYVYFLKFDGDIKKLKVQKEEVQKIEFINIEKIKKRLKTNPQDYTPLGDYWFEVLDEIKRRINLASQ